MNFNIDLTQIINNDTTRRNTRTGVATSVVEEFAETRADRIVSTNIAQSMRTREVSVTGENVKPNTPYFVFFDGPNVNGHMTPTSSTYGMNAGTTKGTGLRSDNIGKVSATFTIPNTDELSFSTGEKTLKITESSTGAASTSEGVATYSANGQIRVMQEDITSTRNGRVIVDELSDTREQVRYQDPLAQSFLVDTKGGIFASSLELYFGAKDIALPVTVQLRHMENGLPTQKILPFGEKTLVPADVNTTADGSTSTKFSFPSPVYLESGREYCIVVSSNSNVYTTWVSEMGQKDIATNDFIDQQPYAGSLFKSQNNSTWTPDQMKDLKMILNRCKFTTGTSANVVFENTGLPAEYLTTNPIETVTGTKCFRVHHYSHGNYDEKLSNVTIAGVTGDRTGSIFALADDTINRTGSGSMVANTQTLAGVAVSPSTGLGCVATITTGTTASTSVVITNPGQGFAAGDTVAFTKDGDVMTFTIDVVKETLGGIPIEYINRTHTAGTGDAKVVDGSAKILADMDSYLITNPGQGFAAGDTVAFTKDGDVMTFTIDVVKETLGGIPIEYINRTHTAGTGDAKVVDGSAKILADMDSYLITIPSSVWPLRVDTNDATPNIQVVTESATGGGALVTATGNVYFDTIHTTIPSIELPKTTITTTMRASTATQPIVLASPVVSFSKDSVSSTITLNDNNTLIVPKLVASGINETNEMGGAKSMEISTQLSSTSDNVSPVLDVDSLGMIGVQNRINNVDTILDVSQATNTNFDSDTNFLPQTFVSSTEARGDSNSAVYMTKRALLSNPANAIHVLFDGFRSHDSSGSPSEIQVYFKTLGSDSNTQFVDIGWTLATIKKDVPADASDFKEYLYEIESLRDFTAFSIKIVMQSDSSSNVPLIENFRAIALST